MFTVEGLMSQAFLFPGQGSQSVGMMASLAESHPVVRETFDAATGVLGYDLWAIAQQGPADQLALTEITQPLMLVAGVGVPPSPPSTHARGRERVSGANESQPLFVASRK